MPGLEPDRHGPRGELRQRDADQRPVETAEALPQEHAGNQRHQAQAVRERQILGRAQRLVALLDDLVAHADRARRKNGQHPARVAIARIVDDRHDRRAGRDQRGHPERHQSVVGPLEPFQHRRQRMRPLPDHFGQGRIGDASANAGRQALRDVDQQQRDGVHAEIAAVDHGAEKYPVSVHREKGQDRRQEDPLAVAHQLGERRFVDSHALAMPLQHEMADRAARQGRDERPGDQRPDRMRGEPDADHAQRRCRLRGHVDPGQDAEVHRASRQGQLDGVECRHRGDDREDTQDPGQPRIRIDRPGLGPLEVDRDREHECGDDASGGLEQPADHLDGPRRVQHGGLFAARRLDDAAGHPDIAEQAQRGDHDVDHGHQAERVRKQQLGQDDVRREPDHLGDQLPADHPGARPHDAGSQSDLRRHARSHVGHDRAIKVVTVRVIAWPCARNRSPSGA